MAIINKGKTFSNGEQLTAAKLNQLVDDATFGNDATDGTSITTTNNALSIKSGGVTQAMLSQSDILDRIYPIGAIFTSASASHNTASAVATALGFGTWVAFGAGKVPVGIDSSDEDFDTAEETGGAKTHTLTEAELAQHHHLAVVDGTVAETGDVTASNAISETATQSGSTFNSYRLRPATSDTFGTVGKTSQVGSGTAHNNLQPYKVVYMYKRTA